MSRYDVLVALKAIYQADTTLDSWSRGAFGNAVNVTIGASTIAPGVGDYPYIRLFHVAEEYDQDTIGLVARINFTVAVQYAVSEENSEKREEYLSDFTDHIKRVIEANDTISSTVIDVQPSEMESDIESIGSPNAFRTMYLTAEMEG